MALVLKDRVKETTTTTGTGTITLDGAVTGFQSFSAVGNGNTTYYAIVAQTPGEWEVGIGTYTSAGTTLSRDTVLASSNSGSLVVFSAGTKDVWCDYPAGTAVFASNNAGTSGQVLASNGTGVAPSWQNVPATTLTISNKTGAYTVIASDNGKIINCTSGTFTVALTAAASLGAGFNCWVWNTGAGAITVDPNAAETIDGQTTIILRQGEGMQIVCDGSNWQTGDKKTMRGYAENFASGSTRATASGSSAMAIGSGANAAAAGAVALGNNTNATGAASVAIGLGTASATNSTIMGNNSSGSGSQAVTGSGAMALGGSYASGTDSFAAAVANNTSSYGATGGNGLAVGYLSKGSALYATGVGYTANATGQGSLALGYTPTASGTASVALSGVASNSYAVAVGSGYNGAGSTASGNGAIALSGSTASGDGSIAIGRAATTQSLYGKFAFSSSGLVAAIGDSQHGVTVLRKATTDATSAVLVSNDASNSAGAANQIILPNNSAYAFSILIVARQQAAGGTASAAWKIEGLIRREANAASTTLVNSATTVLNNAPGWAVAVSADTTNGGLAVTVTGAAATNIRWVATAQTSEVTYA